MHNKQTSLTTDLDYYEKLFKENYSGLCAYCTRIVKDPLQAEEIVQELFCKLWDKRNELNFKENPKAYLTKALKNNSLMHLKKVAAKNNNTTQVEEYNAITSDTALDAIQAKEMDAIILKTLSTLPESWQQIFALIRFEGLKYREVAEKMSISIKTVEKAMGRALKLFRTNLAEYMSLVILMLLLKM